MLKQLDTIHWPVDVYIEKVNERKREMFYFIYGYMASDIWLRTILIVRKETRCCHIGYSYQLTTRVLLYAPSHRQNGTYHSLCYTSRGALAEKDNESTYIKWIQRQISLATAITMSLLIKYFKIPLLLIRKNTHKVTSSGFLSRYLRDHLPYNRK